MHIFSGAMGQQPPRPMQMGNASPHPQQPTLGPVPPTAPGQPQQQSSQQPLPPTAPPSSVPMPGSHGPQPGVHPTATNSSAPPPAGAIPVQSNSQPSPHPHGHSHHGPPAPIAQQAPPARPIGPEGSVPPQPQVQQPPGGQHGQKQVKVTTIAKPFGINPLSILHERENRLGSNMISRLRELSDLPSNLPEDVQTRVQIELRALRLYNFQRQLRQEVLLNFFLLSKH